MILLDKFHSQRFTQTGDFNAQPRLLGDISNHLEKVLRLIKVIYASLTRKKLTIHKTAINLRYQTGRLHTKHQNQTVWDIETYELLLSINVFLQTETVKKNSPIYPNLPNTSIIPERDTIFLFSCKTCLFFHNFYYHT